MTPTAPPYRTGNPNARLRVRVSPVAESLIRSGHPWVYSASLRDHNRAGRAGELAVVYDRNDKFLAIGLYDPDSPIQLRILHHGKPAQVDAAFWRARMTAAFEKRLPLFGPETDGYRLVAGESDGWPGLVIDRYAGTLVLKIYSGAWLGSLSGKPCSEPGQDRLPGLDLIPLISELATEIFKIAPEDLRIVLRLSRNIKELAERASYKDGQNLLGNSTAESVVFHENGLRFESDVVRGQKTGFFLDQRENRQRVGEMAQGADVLNAFSFSGGFSLYAARGGARTVTDLDISPYALEAARKNFSLNTDVPGIVAATHEQLQGDVFEWLETSPERNFSLVILDPPSLAKRESEREGAINAYARLALGGLRRTRPGGLLLCASCSAHVSEDEFFCSVREAVVQSGLKVKELKTTGHAPDHPATFYEAKYLKAIYLRVES